MGFRWCPGGGLMYILEGNLIGRYQFLKQCACGPVDVMHAVKERGTIWDSFKR